MKGIYFLLIKLKEPTTKRVGALGDIRFKSGNYIYVGSAQNSLEGRVSRHLGSEKRKHWHIDYLLEDAEIKEVLAFELEENMECDSARTLKEEFSEVEDFGCSDCRCDSHLFFTRESFKELIGKITTYLGKEEARLKDLDLQ